MKYKVFFKRKNTKLGHIKIPLLQFQVFSEMSQKKTLKILATFQLRKIYLRPLCLLAVRFSASYQEALSLMRLFRRESNPGYYSNVCS